MRLKHVPGAEEALANQPDLVIQEPEKYKGRFCQLFDNGEAPLHIEIGAGKGQFIIEMAKHFPNINFIAIELQTSVIYRALEKLLEEEISNVKLLNVHAGDLSDLFAEGEVDQIYLNFSDPWHKRRHRKRRLTHYRFLANYQTVLKEGGFLDFKTDNRALFEFSLKMFNGCSCRFEELSLNLHEDTDIFNIQTEYEEKFSQKGHNIHYIKVSFENFSLKRAQDLDDID